MTIELERLSSLIDFAKESAKLRRNPISDVTRYSFYEYEHNLREMPRLHFNTSVDEEEIWLSVDRLHETNAPTTNQSLLELWLKVSNDPSEEPTLINSVEFSKLLDLGFVGTDTKNISFDTNCLITLQEFEKADEVFSQFKAYKTIQWLPWAIEERKRRLTINLYGRLFTLKQQLEGSITDCQIEIAWGSGMCLWNMGGNKVSHPLITRLVDIVINESSMAIEIRPRNVEAQLEIDIFTTIDNIGILELEKAYKDFMGKITQTFSPFDKGTFDGILRTAVACLDSKGIYWPTKITSDDRKLPPVSEELKITDTWVLISRPRSKNSFIQDLERFKNNIEEKVSILPKAIMALLTEPANVNKDIIFPSFRGISMVQGYDGDSNSSNKKVSDLYFPMPFNDEQVRIVQMLEHHDGVVVQGPPGTGKTHTIANIICHYFALGKRVLVTSMKEPALAVLRDKLPEEIRPLAISLLSNEQEGMKQFEYAVSKIASEIQVIDKNIYKKDITQLEQSIDLIHANLAKIDRKINDWAKKNLDPVRIGDELINPVDVANEVIKGNGHYEWLEDKLTQKNIPLFTNSDITKLREARLAVANDMDYLDVALPEILILPDAQDLVRTHQDLSNHSKLEDAINSGDLPHISSYKDAIQDAHLLLDKIQNLISLSQQIEQSGKGWHKNMRKFLKKTSESKIAILKIFDALGDEIAQAITERNFFLTKPVSTPKNIELDTELTSAIQNIVDGKLPFGLSGLIGKGASKKKLEEIKVLSNSPKTKEDWEHVQKYIALQKRFCELVTRWNSVASELDIECFEVVEPAHAIKAEKNFLLYRLIQNHIALETQIVNQSLLLLPNWKRHSEIEENIECLQELQNFLDNHTLRHRLSKAYSNKENLQKIISNYGGKIIDDLNNFTKSTLGNPSISDTEFKEHWSSLIEELKRIHGLKSAFADINYICNQIAESGAEKWAKKLRSKPANTSVDNLLPDNWQKAWRLKFLATHLETTDAREELKKLSRERNDSEILLAKTYRDIVAKRTWLKLTENATPDIRSALEAFRTAITKIGKGTGKRAAIFRQNARNASERANQAIPCWIMPHWRVSESLPSLLGCFDLVIIDEASQSDLSALPALLRAKKVLIVGDDKQVSPDGSFLEVDKIKNLMTRYLANQVDIFRSQMDPSQSIYDLFKVVFAQSGTMLKEHFRCVGPIIEYSKREVYNHELKPVRLPKASERLDPPLVDVLIEDGFRKGDINIPEARFIVNEIKKICADENMRHRTIGVVSLIADKQTLEIWKMLELEVGPEIIKRHEIACGDARTFQGKERDIMFLSMIVSLGDAQAQTKESTAQRFNVASSRARDRMYLVRSIELDQLSPSDKLRRSLISHFTKPFAQDEQCVKNLRLLCESDFEKEVYDILTERGYRIIPQVKVGEYRIDMVAEGHNDARLAIECDGDRYHGADRWESDMNRQRILERVGWKFWRCFASTFVRHRQEVIDDLIAHLSERGIEPIGINTAPSSIHSEQRRVTVSSLNS
jgi:superfamily I DNA and/or RNA helicase